MKLYQTTSSISRRRATGTAGSTSRIACRNVDARLSSGNVVLTTTCIVVGEIDRKLVRVLFSI
jgi:hypothetical protein